MSVDATGPLQQITGSASLFTRNAVCSGSLVELSGDATTPDINYSSAEGSLRRLSGRSVLHPSGKGLLAELSGSATTIHTIYSAATGSLNGISGEARGIVRVLGYGSGLLTEISGQAAIQRIIFSSGVGRLRGISGSATASANIENRGTGALSELAGMASSPIPVTTYGALAYSRKYVCGGAA